MIDRWFSEPLKIVTRRFTNRILESSLLVLAVALGVGATSAGLSLLMFTRQQGRELLSSPTYREIVVMTEGGGEEEDMETPVVESSIEDTAILTHSDLAVRDVVPLISNAYIENERRMRFPGDQPPPRPPSGGTEEGENPQSERMSRFFEEMSQRLQEAGNDTSIIIPDFDRAFGASVTPEYFEVWELEAEYGSLFTDSDLVSTDSIVVVGSSLAELLHPEGDPASLIGKRLFSFEDGLYTVVGCLSATGTDIDTRFFIPERDPTLTSGGRGGLRRRDMNRQLRFSVEDPAHLQEASALLKGWFDEEFGTGRTTISTPRAEAEQIIARNTGIGALILFLALAALFIASVNIFHILMGRALKMRKHSGILIALGATRRDILKIFIQEAVIITVGGAVAGGLLAIPLGRTMQQALSVSTGSPLYLLSGALLAWIITFSFALATAFRGARVVPAEAIRLGT